MVGIHDVQSHSQQSLRTKSVLMKNVVPNHDTAAVHDRNNKTWSNNHKHDCDIRQLRWNSNSDFHQQLKAERSSDGLNPRVTPRNHTLNKNKINLMDYSITVEIEIHQNVIRKMGSSHHCTGRTRIDFRSVQRKHLKRVKN